MIKKIALLLIVIFIFSTCASKFYSLENRISVAVSPADIINISVDIATSDLPANEKHELSLKLAKRAISVFSLYIKYFTDKKQLPPKDDILDMLDYVKKNLNTLTDKDTLSELTRMALKLGVLLKDTYLKF